MSYHDAMEYLAEVDEYLVKALGDVLTERAEQTWRRDAACLGVSVSVFYPERGRDQRSAKAICVSCPVRAECAAAGQRERFGIWAGQGERARRRDRDQRPNQPAA